MVKPDSRLENVTEMAERILQIHMQLDSLDFGTTHAQFIRTDQKMKKLNDRLAKLNTRIKGVLREY